MSWSVSTVALPNQVQDRVNALVAPGEEYGPRDDQVKIAKQVAVEIVESGAVGGGEAYTISLYGHANDGHQPQAGYANDTVTVSVTQTTAAAVDQFDAAHAQAQKALE